MKKNNKNSLGFYKFATSVMSGVFKFLFRIKVVGSENENFGGSAIYCANHMSNWDPVIVACMTKRPMNFVAKKELFDVPLLKNLLKSLGASPIDRSSNNDILALRTIMGILKNGGNLAMFPQGTRCPGVEPSTTEIKNGISLFAKHSKATVLPIALYTKDYKMRFFKRTYVVIGKPITFEQLNFQDGSREEFDRVSRLIFDEICKLCDNAKNGVYDGK